MAALVEDLRDGFLPDEKVLLTNLILTLACVFLFGFTSEVFNATMDENRLAIEGWAGRMMAGPLRFLAPLAVLDARLDRLTEQGPRGLLIHAGVVLGLTGLVYGFLSPDFGLNPGSLTLYLALVFGLGLLTYLDEGATSLLARRRQGAPSAVRMYGTAIAVAIVFVLISRLLDLRPGFLYGFVASAVILAPVALGRAQRAQLVVVPSLLVLATAMIAWALLEPVRGALAASGGWPLGLADSILTIVFVAGIEGLFFALIPVHFMDGAVVMRWSRIGWGLLFGIVTFLWWELIVNRDGEYTDAFKHTAVQVVIGALLVYMLTTGAIWAYFRWRERREESVEEVGGGEA